MRSLRAEAGEAPAAEWCTGGRVLRFDPRLADRRGWRLVECVAESRGVALDDLLQRDRGLAGVAMARQIAMYLMHTHFGRQYAEVGRFFRRDRTTVSHACGLIEELREDADFDAAVSAIEAALQLEADKEREAAHAAA